MKEDKNYDYFNDNLGNRGDWCGRSVDGRYRISHRIWRFDLWSVDRMVDHPIIHEKEEVSPKHGLISFSFFSQTIRENNRVYYEKGNC